MSITSEKRMKLMAFADGELEGDEREEVLAWLSTDVDAVRFVNDVAALGAAIKLGHEGSKQAEAIAAFDAADAILAKVAVESGVRVASPAVVPFDAARARRQRNVKIGAAAVVTLALAASVALLTRPRGEEAMATLAPPAAEAVQVSGAGPGVDVDLVESPGQTVSVFYLPSESSLTTSVVVWVDERGEK